MATIENAHSRLVELLRRNALSRMAIMAAFLMVWLIGFRGFVVPSLRGLGEPGSVMGDAARLTGALAYGAGALFIYRTLTDRIEQRTAVELARKPGFTMGLLGLATGSILSCVAIGLILLAGAAQVTGFGDAARLTASFSAAILGAMGEELLFRGILFRILEQAFGTFVALLASALLFGLAHIVNPDSTLIGALAIAVEAGLLLGLAYVVTRNLWFPIGIHLAWNFTQGGIFGLGSGKQDGLVRLAFPGPDWLTGGASGAESSMLTVALCLALASVFALLAVRRGEWKPPKLRLRLD